nr:hypothetical protein [Bacteroidota bacterium]
MEALFKIKATEIDSSFIESVKRLFKGKEIIIRITSPGDDSEYLASYKANKDHILENMAAEPTMRFSSEQFHHYVVKKS